MGLSACERNIITTPTLRADGSLLADPGYDPQSGLYLLATLQLSPFPEHPTKEQARAALDMLVDLLSEFPFAKMIDRSVAIGPTPSIRATPSPFCIDSRETWT